MGERVLPARLDRGFDDQVVLEHCLCRWFHPISDLDRQNSMKVNSGVFKTGLLAIVLVTSMVLISLKSRSFTFVTWRGDNDITNNWTAVVGEFAI